MPELIQTLQAMQKVEFERRKFQAKLKGIDLGDEEAENGPSFDDIRRRALGINASADDVVSLQGPIASEAGFGVGMGLGYIQEINT